MNADKAALMDGVAKEKKKREILYFKSHDSPDLENPGFVVRLPPVYSTEVLKREAFIEESLS